ncbi:MAG: carbamoyl phosphate synthase small subunit [Clostridia bacterium]|nr:carbamoyl phosphate synthase small subunit [Clostridia bacterium]
MKKRYLILENKEILEGIAFGCDCERVGELVFTTNMCGYIETLTDPSYYGQIVMHTFPQIGNYGIIPSDFEGKSSVFGYVVREYCDEPSNFRCEKTLDAFLKENGIPGISGIDTRYLTKLTREYGVMNAMISNSPDADFDLIKNYCVTNAVPSVSVSEPEIFCPEITPKFSVALIDYGSKKNIINELIKRACKVTLFPHNVCAETILDGNFDGVMLSNGPGDPADNVFEISQIKKLMNKIPIFGICLGHQLMALANGAKTEKLKYGHRGGNQPVSETNGHRTFISSQNHGYAVTAKSVKNGIISYVNANDKTVEGIDYKTAFSVQFHPEACSGPKDTEFLFDKFLCMMKEKNYAEK